MVTRKINAVVLEDELETRAKIIKCLKHFNEIKIIGEAASVNEAFSIISEKNPDVAFMDIKLNGGDAFYLLERLQKNQLLLPYIVMVSGFPEYAVKSLNEYRGKVIHFIEKPFLENWHQKFTGAIDSINVMMLNQRERESIAFKSEGQYIRLNIKDIAWLEVGKGGTIYVVTDTDGFKVDQTLRKFINELGNPDIQQVSREFAINITRIKRVDPPDRTVIIKYKNSEKQIGIGERYYRDLINRL